MPNLPDYSDALVQALQSVRAIERRETVVLGEASGRVLAEAIAADRDLPPFDRAMMDGYALRSAEFGAGAGAGAGVAMDRAWPVSCTVAAGASPDVMVPAGACVAIATGAALPEGLDAVIQHELSDRGNPVRFKVDAVAKWNSVHRRGADAKQGDVLVREGTRLRSQHLGIAAAVGAVELRVHAQPKVAILTSGDEVVATDLQTSQLEAHQIRNSNAVMIAALVKRTGAGEVTSTHVRDEKAETVAAVREAIAAADLVITVGGVSAGDRDHFPAAFEANDVMLQLNGAAIQPGRPVCVGRAKAGAVVVALPGNPVSALACACLFVWPIVLKMMHADESLPWREVELLERVKPNAQRRAFRPATMVEGRGVRVPQWAGSGDLAHTAQTDGLLELPVQGEAVEAGMRLRFLPWP